MAKYCELGDVTESAPAQLASPDCMRFQAVINSAAEAAFRKPKVQGSARAMAQLADDGLGALPWILGSLEAALAADLITALKLCRIRGRCTSSRLYHGLEGYCLLLLEAALAADLITVLKLCEMLVG